MTPGTMRDARVRHNGSTSLTEEVSMLLAIAVILLIAWALGFLAFHAAGGLIHLLIVMAVIAFVLHLFRRPGVA
jgi:uncharacterized membrane protein (DUF485 family)